MRLPAAAYPVIRREARRLAAKVKSPVADADDYFQAAVERLLVDEYDRRRGHLGAFVATRARHAAVDEARRMVFRAPRTSPVEELVREPATTDPDPVDLANTKAAIEHLPPRLSLTVCLHMSDVPLATIGRAFGVTESRASQWWTLARRRLAYPLG